MYKYNSKMGIIESSVYENNESDYLNELKKLSRQIKYVKAKMRFWKKKIKDARSYGEMDDINYKVQKYFDKLGILKNDKAFVEYRLDIFYFYHKKK